MVRSGSCVIVVVSLAVSLLALISPPPDTVATLVTESAALLAFFCVWVFAVWLLPLASASDRVQLRVPRVQLHPVPLMAVAVRPLGKVSVRSEERRVGKERELLAVTV